MNGRRVGLRILLLRSVLAATVVGLNWQRYVKRRSKPFNSQHTKTFVRVAIRGRLLTKQQILIINIDNAEHAACVANLRKDLGCDVGYREFRINCNLCF